MIPKRRILPLITALALTISLLAACSESAGYQSDSYLSEADGGELVVDSNKQTEETAGQNDTEPVAVLLNEEPEITAAETTAATEEATTTTTTAATTTALPTVSAPASDAPAAIKGINNETFLAYDTICERYKPTAGRTCYLYNFNTSLSAGFGVNGAALPTEADYGIKGTLKGKTINFIIYDHTHSKALRGIYMQALDTSAYNDATVIETAAMFSLDTSEFANGLYRVVACFADERQLALYFYVNGNETWLCEQNAIAAYTENTYEARRSDLMKVLAEGNVTPENSLALDKLYYPFKSTDSRIRCDTQLWIDLSNTFINDNWSDEYKLYVIQAWIRENIAYDTLVSGELNHSRAQHYRDLSGAQSVYDLRAGVCFDYVNIIAIMCRAHGIPAVTIGSAGMNHVWNVVYVNNRWMEYDACLSDQYYVGEDTTVRIKSGEPIYGGIYTLIINNNGTGKMPSDALANQYLQWDTNYLY